MSNMEDRKVYFLNGSGSYHLFTFYPLDAELEDVGAVYIFTRDNDGNYETLYIGQTDNLHSCINQHDKWTELHRHFVNSICVLYEEDDATRQQIVDDLVVVHKPTCS